jgi:hypothetical protein
VKERGIFTSADHMIVNHGDYLNIYFTTPLLAGCFQDDDPAYIASQFNDYNRVAGFDSDLWNNAERFTEEEVAEFLDNRSETIMKAVTIFSSSSSPAPSPTKKVYFLPENGAGMEQDWLEDMFQTKLEFVPVPSDTGDIPEQSIVLWNNVKSTLHMANLLNRLQTKKLILLNLSDEHDEHDISMYADAAMVIRNYTRPNLPAHAHVIPLGYANGRRGTGKTPSFEKRTQLWSFAGSTDRPNRSHDIDAMRKATPYTVFTKDNFFSPNVVEGPAYLALLQDTKFVPCFQGFSLECYRFYEALEHGAIPIYVPVPGLRDSYKDQFGEHPFLSFPSWERAAEILPQLAKQPSVMESHREKILAWWEAKKQSVRDMLGSCLH